jgi:hypothetical protein
MRANTAKSRNKSVLESLSELDLGRVHGGSGKPGSMPGLGAGAGSLNLPSVQSWMASNPLPASTRVALPPMTGGPGPSPLQVSGSGPTPFNWSATISQPAGSFTTHTTVFNGASPYVGQGIGFGISKKW